MTDNNNEPTGKVDEQKPVANQEPKADEGKKEDVPAWKVIAGDKFKNEAELAKAYSELEKEKGSIAAQLGEAREFTQTIQPLLEVIRDDPELFKQLDERMKSKGIPKDLTKASPEEKSKASDEVRSVATDLIISRFEESKGIDKLTPEQRKTSREKIGTVISEMTGQALTDIDLRRLGSVLENAYTLANKDEMIEKSKLEALAQAQGLDSASIASLQSSQVKKEDGLSPEEGRVAERMGLSREQYLEGKKKVNK